jgi:uncharacterized membrane protein
MNGSLMKSGAVLALVAIVSFSLWPLWEWISVKQANAELQARVRTLVEKHPELKPALKIALMDGKLTWEEARAIVEAAGEKLPPDR